MRTQKQAEKQYCKLLAQGDLKKCHYARKMKMWMELKHYPISGSFDGLNKHMHYYFIQFPLFDKTYCIKIYYK